jgi:hypothetical protein
MKCAFRIIYALILPSIFFSGCVHSLGESPTDLELRNDGDAESRNHLYSVYKVVYEDGYFKRPYSPEYRTDATSDSAINYLGASEEAEDALTTVPIAIDRFCQPPSFEASLTGLGLAAGGALGVFVAIQSVQSNTQNLNAVTADQLMKDGMTVGSGGAAGAMAGLFASVPLAVITSLIARPVIRSIASVDYRAAAKAFNQDLESRIEKQVKEDLVKPPAIDAQPEEVSPYTPRIIPSEPYVLDTETTVVDEQPTEAEVEVEDHEIEKIESPEIVDSIPELIEAQPEQFELGGAPEILAD